jgi:hypothetical protein
VTSTTPSALSQLAFAKESALLDRPDTVDYYINHLLPAKAAMDVFYARNRSLTRDFGIFGWTFVAVFRRDVAVHRDTGRLTLRRREPSEALEAVETAR